MSWWVYALLSLLFWGLWGFFSKVAANHLSGWAIFLYEVPVYGLIAVLVWWLWQPEMAGHRVGAWMAALAGLCGGLGLICFLQALTGRQASVIVPLTSLYPVITALLSVLILREQPSMSQWLGILLALLAVWLLSR